MANCEDKPCCVHGTEPCDPQWYDAPGAFDTSIRGNEHALCEHEIGFCDVEDEEEDYEDDDDFDWVRYHQEGELAQMEYDMGIEPMGWQDSY